MTAFAHRPVDAPAQSEVHPERLRDGIAGSAAGLQTIYRDTVAFTARNARSRSGGPVA